MHYFWKKVVKITAALLIGIRWQEICPRSHLN